MNHMDNYSMVPLGETVITLESAAIVSYLPPGEDDFTYGDMVRGAVTSFGAWALRDYGSVSGYYLGPRTDQTTCFLHKNAVDQCSPKKYIAKNSVS